MVGRQYTLALRFQSLISGCPNLRAADALEVSLSVPYHVRYPVPREPKHAKASKEAVMDEVLSGAWAPLPLMSARTCSFDADGMSSGSSACSVERDERDASADPTCSAARSGADSATCSASNGAVSAFSACETDPPGSRPLWCTPDFGLGAGGSADLLYLDFPAGNAGLRWIVAVATVAVHWSGLVGATVAIHLLTRSPKSHKGGYGGE